MRSPSPSLHLLPLSPPIPLFRALLSPSLPPCLSHSLTFSLSFSSSQIFPLRSFLLFLPSFFHNLCLVPRVPPLLTPLSLLLDPWHIHSPGRSSPSSEPREPVRVWSPRLKNAAVYPLCYRTRESFSKSYRNCNEKLDGRSRSTPPTHATTTCVYVDVQRVPTRCWNVGNVLIRLLWRASRVIPFGRTQAPRSMQDIFLTVPCLQEEDWKMYGGGAARKNNGVVCVQRVKRVERSSTSRSRQRLQ